MTRTQSTLFYYGSEQLLAQLKIGKLDLCQDWSILEPYLSFDQWHAGSSQLITEQEMQVGLQLEFDKLPENIRQLLGFDAFLTQRDKVEASVKAQILQSRSTNVSGYQRTRLNNAGYLRLFSTALSDFGWQQLASNFKGLCIGINRSAQSMQPTAGNPVVLKPVQYGQPHALFADASNVIPGAFNDAPESAARGEWRMIAPTNKLQTPTCRLQKNDVSEIYVSVHASQALIDDVKQLVAMDMRYRRTRLMQVFPDATKWRLTARPLSD